MIFDHIGKCLSFSQLFDQIHHIEIPMIQRDYAQGRSEATEVRQQFLKDLHAALSNPMATMTQPLDLHFVYGSIEGNPGERLFIPLDGQQRLTTLFLLHWYLACCDKKTDEFFRMMVKDGHSRFTYKTRTSSKDFCDALVNHPIDLDHLESEEKDQKNSLSRTIENSEWFFLSWLRDPTIRSMLTMLDAIHADFSLSEGFYSKLVQTTKPCITFQFLQLKDFGLSPDELYIKMNARGKSLSAFEIFKAEFEKELVEWFPGATRTLHKKTISVKEYFSHKIDTDWADLFWFYRSKKENPQDEALYDDQIMNFIHVLATVHFPLKDKLPGKESIGKALEAMRPTQNTFSFYRYRDLQCFDDSFATWLITLFDAQFNGNQGVKKYLPNADYYDEEFFFKEIVGKREKKFYLEYVQYVQFCAYSLFLVESKGSPDCQAFQQWMRIIRNLSANSPYDNVDDLSDSLNQIKKFLAAASDILSHVGEPSNAIAWFNKEQVQEERIKAQLLLKGGHWPESVFMAEHQGYFDGQIGFLLEFSGISDFYRKENHCKWDPTNDGLYFQLFNLYFEKANAIFDARGLRAFPDYLWERALLCEGDYLLESGAVRFSFLKNKDRDLSWKKLLQNKEKSLVVKRVLDRVNVKSVEQDLQNIVSGTTFSDNDWRECFVRCPQAIDYCEARKTLWDWDNQVYLLSREIRSAEYGELRTFFLFKSEMEGHCREFQPFTCEYFFMQGKEDLPHIVLEGFARGDTSHSLEIRYRPEKGYELRFSRKDGMNTVIEQDIPFKRLLCDSLMFRLENNLYIKSLPCTLSASNVAVDLKLIAAKLAGL